MVVLALASAVFPALFGLLQAPSENAVAAAAARSSIRFMECLSRLAPHAPLKHRFVRLVPESIKCACGTSGLVAEPSRRSVR
jgi:hypothetical protein